MAIWAPWRVRRKMSCAWRNGSAQTVSSGKATRPSMRPTLVKVLQLSTAEVLEGTLREQGSENEPKFLSVNNFSKEYKIHYTIFLTDCKLSWWLVDFLSKHCNQNNLWEKQNLCYVVTCEKGSFINTVDINGFNHKIFPKSEGLYALDEHYLLSVSEKFLEVFCCNNNTSAIYCKTMRLFNINLQHVAKFHQWTINSCWAVTCFVN